jgi:hypothetical protein
MLNQRAAHPLNFGRVQVQCIFIILQPQRDKIGALVPFYIHL